MTRQGQSLYIESVGPMDDAIKLGFKWLIQRCRETSSCGLIAVGGKQNLSNIANWSDLGPIFTALQKRGQYQKNGVTLLLHTLRKPASSQNGPVLAIYGGQELLDSVDSIYGEMDVLYIPWAENDQADWASTWNASILGDKKSTEKEPLSGISHIALQSLTNSVNLNTGIVHPCDKEAAVRTLETLFYKGADCNPELIRQQLIRMGWEPEDASSVKVLAEKIWEGRRPRSSTGKPNEDSWGYWLKKLEANE